MLLCIFSVFPIVAFLSNMSICLSGLCTHLIKRTPDHTRFLNFKVNKVNNWDFNNDSLGEGVFYMSRKGYVQIFGGQSDALC